MPKANGTVSEIQLLRPTAWLEAQGIAAIGKSTYLHLSEMGLEGYATVTDLAHFRVTKNRWQWICSSFLLPKRTKNNITRWFGSATQIFCQVVFNERSSTILSKRYKADNQRLV
jgi:hypothetical protein